MAKPVIVQPELQEDDIEYKDGDKTEPRLPDDEGGDDDMEIDVIQEEKGVIYRPANADEQRRAFIFYQMADSDIDGETLVKNMDAVCKWLKDGTMPQKHERKLKTVKPE